MTIQFRVTWPNARHPLLPESGVKIVVEADGAPASLVSSQPGVREFLVEGTPSGIVMKAEFSVSLRAVGATPAQQATVLTASQRYRVTDGGNTIEPQLVDPFQQQHPLVDSKVLIAKNAAILAQVHTDFVNITPLWNAYTRTKQPDIDHADEYAREANPNHVELVALGYTAGLPLIWFASIPNAAFLTSSRKVSALVYYRPANGPYRRVDQVHTTFRLNRFLLSPDPDADATQFWRADRIFPNDGDFFVWLRRGFEEALFNSQKELVMLHPWPSGQAFGDAATAKLPAAAESALRFLWSEQRLAANRFDLSLGSLGLMGYSAGGDVLWQSLQANAGRVSEVYAFDANHTGAQDGLLKAWFKAATDRGEDPRLFMAVGLHVAAGAAVTAAVKARMAQAGVVVGDDKILSIPRSLAEYSQGTIPNLMHAVENQPSLRNDGNTRHQFPVFGRYERFPGEPPEQHVTFFQQFLEKSAF